MCQDERRLEQLQAADDAQRHAEEDHRLDAGQRDGEELAGRGA